MDNRRRDRGAHDPTPERVKRGGGRLGDAPIEPEHHQRMNVIARVLDEQFNGPARGKDRKVGFVLLVFPFDSQDGRCNYISNGANRQDICTMFREQIARFEGQPELKGSV